jgi:hypothetical protein
MRPPAGPRQTFAVHKISSLVAKLQYLSSFRIKRSCMSPFSLALPISPTLSGVQRFHRSVTMSLGFPWRMKNTRSNCSRSPSRKFDMMLPAFVAASQVSGLPLSALRQLTPRSSSPYMHHRPTHTYHHPTHIYHRPAGSGSHPHPTPGTRCFSPAGSLPTRDPRTSLITLFDHFHMLLPRWCVLSFDANTRQRRRSITYINFAAKVVFRLDDKR